MFETLMATAVLPASDLDRARTWWHDVLGRDPVHDQADGAGLFYDVGGTIVMVYLTQFAGTAENTAFNLMTDDLDRDMAALRDRGVSFHEYDLPGLTTNGGVAELGDERSAWFSDSEGNIFAIGELSPEMTARLRQLVPNAPGA
jgi:catechol 2,3-dioxygenase-like lactoylglutathione lyase family enzyme